MSQNLNLKRLSIALRELWQTNKLKIASIPLIMLIAFAAFYLWPTGIFFKKLFEPRAYAEPDAWIQAVADERSSPKVLLLFLVPLYVVICTKPYLDRLNRSARTTLLPISVPERTAALTLFALAVTALATACFFVYDYALIHWFKSLYQEDVRAYLNRGGGPYEIGPSGTLFKPVDSLPMLVAVIGVFLLLPLYFLSFVFFRRHSFLLFQVLLVGIAAMLSLFLPLTAAEWVSPGISIPLDGLFPRTLHVLLALAYWGFAMGAFYHKLKEKEV